MRPINLGSSPPFEDGGRAVGIQVGGVDHQDIAAIALWLGNFTDEALEYAILRPSSEAVVERLVWAAFGWGVCSFHCSSFLVT